MIQLGSDERGSFAILNMGVCDGFALADRGERPLLVRFEYFSLGDASGVEVDSFEAESPTDKVARAIADEMNESLDLERAEFDRLEEAILDQIREDRRENEMAEAHD